MYYPFSIKLIYRWLLFFVFFVSFSVVNIDAIDWGLQVSWLLGVIFICFSLLIMCVAGNFSIFLNGNIKAVSIFFIVIVFNSILALYLGGQGLFDLDSYGASVSRSISHLLYFTFGYMVFIFSSIYLKSIKVHDAEFRCLITYSFYFITIWGLYQWISTFDVIPYWRILNNNLSTGFTYERFNFEHRNSSVFPEPSEYAYYLAFIFPFIYEFIRRSVFFSNKIVKYPMFVLCMYAFSVLSSRSMSFFVMMPALIAFVYFRSSGFSFKKFCFLFLGLFFIASLLFIFDSGRFSQLAGGEDGSAIVRYTAFLDSVNLFFESPIIGVGFGAIRGMDLLSFLFATTGVVGVLMLIYLVFSLKPINRGNKLFYDGLVCMLIVSLISNPVLDMLFFWVILAFISNPLTITKINY